MILVFGGGGQLGRELVRAAEAKGISLTALPRVAADITEPAAVERTLAEVKPRLIVNAASFTNVDLAEREIVAAERDNVRGPSVIATSCARIGVPVIHVSTDYVFGGDKADPYTENDPIAPLGVYGRTKAGGEASIRDAIEPHVILRTSWLYGEFGHNFLKTILRLAQEREELRVVADQYGCPTSTRDLAGAILRISSRIIAGDKVWGTYHFAGSGIASWYEFAHRIVTAQSSMGGRTPRVTAITSADFPTAARRPANSALDCSLFESVFGFRGRPWQDEADQITWRLVLNRQQIGQEHVA